MLHLKNQCFHLLTVMVGTRNTPDEAYRVLYFELEDRKRAYDGSQAQLKRNLAKRARLEKALENPADECERLELEADLMELESGEATMKNAIAGCEFEMDFISKVMADLLPHCSYIKPDLSNLGEAFIACQSEEWKREFIKRSENFLLTTGTIPTDHWEIMRAHPEFESEILPTVEAMKTLQLEGGKNLAATSLITPKFVTLLQDKYQHILPAATPPATQLAAPSTVFQLGAGS